jgi:hypothetical protein
MNLFVVGNPRLPSVSTLNVFFGRNHDSKCSRYIRCEKGRTAQREMKKCC